MAHCGHTLEWIASEVGVTPRRIQSWVSKGLFGPYAPGQGRRDGYSRQFLSMALSIHDWLQLYPRGPLENLRDQLWPPEDEG